MIIVREIFLTGILVAIFNPFVNSIIPDKIDLTNSLEIPNS